MKNLFRICAISILALVPVFTAYAQNKEVPTREEFECIRLQSSPRVVPNGPPDRVLTYHHVWVPDMKTYPFSASNLDLAYNTEGAGKELVIVVAGGPGMPREYFQPVLSPLGRFVKLLYYDRRADTRSTRPPFDNVTIAEMADDLDALRQTVGYNRVTLLAHSFGGAIALDYALRYPEHVKRLILVSTSAYIEDQRNVERRLMQALPADQLAAFTATEAQGRSTIPCQQIQSRYRLLFPTYFRKPLEAKYADVNPYSVYFDALARKLVTGGNEGGFDVRARLGEIKVPTLIIAGRYDQATPLNHADALAKGIPYSRLAVFNHSAHFPFIEETFLFTEWVRQFIAGTTDLLDDQNVRQEIATPALDLDLSGTPKEGSTPTRSAPGGAPTGAPSSGRSN